MKKSWQLPRRTLLRGAGAAIALPQFEAIAAKAPATPPSRMLFVYLPNGLEMEYFTPANTGPLTELPRILQPLAPFKDQFSVLSGLDNSEPGHGGGDTWLTQVKLDATPGFAKKNYISADQAAAGILGQDTRFPSLELTGVAPKDSTTYARSLAWSPDGIPIPGESSVRAVFERLFRDETKEGLQQTLRRLKRKKSILDTVLSPAQKLHRNLGRADQQKLDEYLTSVREVEKQIERAEAWAAKPKPKPQGSAPATDPNPERARSSFLKAMFDMAILAFQTDSTRVATFMTGREAANNVYTEVGTSDGHHALSHWTTEEQKEKFIRFNTLDIAQLAYLLGKLQGATEASSTMLDHTTILCGSALRRAGHSSKAVPTILAGNTANLHQGHHHQFPENTPMANLLLTLLQQQGLEQSTFGISTGTLSGLTK